MRQPNSRPIPAMMKSRSTQAFYTLTIWRSSVQNSKRPVCWTKRTTSTKPVVSGLSNSTNRTSKWTCARRTWPVFSFSTYKTTPDKVLHMSVSLMHSWILRDSVQRGSGVNGVHQWYHYLLPIVSVSPPRMASTHVFKLPTTAESHLMARHSIGNSSDQV